MSCAGFWDKWGSWPQDENWQHGQNRVFHSTDGGLTYEGVNFSIGLPYFPVNNLAYQKGAGILYAATDIGVYYKKLNEPNAVWTRFCDNLPVCIVSEMEINYCAQKLRIATFGRGLWEADLIPSEQEITSSMVWSSGSERVVPNNLVIKSGATLTMKGTAFMPEDGKIIIEQGGKLIVDGGTITNQCGKMWRGIEVWGDMNLSQMVSGTQGVLEVKNGALIENCYSIHASKHIANQYVWGTFGGIIKISNSTIKNVKSGVEFGPYQNFNPNNPSALLSDLSYIKDNQFIWDNTGNMASNGINPYSFIGLWEVHGVGIQGNTFKNNFYSNEPQYQKGVGIITYDADFSVLPSSEHLTPYFSKKSRNTL